MFVVAATDADSGTNGEISYSLPPPVCRKNSIVIGEWSPTLVILVAEFEYVL